MRFSNATVNCQARYTSGGAPTGKNHLMHILNGSPREVLSFIAQNSRAMGKAKTRTDSWAGFHQESPAKAIEALNSKDAHSVFQKNDAELLAPLKARAKPIASPVGASFNMGRILSGHPIACYRRPRVKLPPKTINVCLSVSARINEEQIAKTISKIARAAWEYHLQGGAVKFVMHTLYFYSAPSKDGAKGMLISCDLPIQDVSAIATGASVQFFRGFGIPLAKAYSGAGAEDALWPGDYLIPGMLTLCGDPVKDAKILASLGVKG